jgi:para-nitrobenzyl esterase
LLQLFQPIDHEVHSRCAAEYSDREGEHGLLFFLEGGVLKPLTVLLTAAWLCATSFGGTTPTVTVGAGALAGTKVGTVEIFKGIPYAAPPVGPLRWAPPAPPASWNGARDASAFGAICPQPPRPETALAAEEDRRQSEDCLFLNVWTFEGAKKAPVMVWIHGGAFRFGSGSGRAYDGGDFARDGVVLVTINYRLGALGFFAHPALTQAAAADAPLGNYGILDQIAALQWVQRNIAAFGGDPANVTVFGESAGGTSVLTLLSLPAAKGLFAKAIVESGGGWRERRTLAEEEKAGLKLAAAAGLGAAATLPQLRALPPEKLFDLPMRLGAVGPFEDGRFIQQSATEAFAAGRILHVPLIVGSNSYEASLMKSFEIPAGPIAARVPASAKPLYAGTDEEVAAEVFTDAVMGAPARWIAAQASAGAPAYLYYFSYVPVRRRSTAPGASHGSEIPFVFGGWPDIFNRLASPEEHAMESLLHGCWVAFAKTGKPVCGDKAWPAYSAATDELMEFGAKPGPEANFRKARYDALQRALLPRLIPGGRPPWQQP